jgi:hypothetical protein
MVTEPEFKSQTREERRKKAEFRRALERNAEAALVRSGVKSPSMGFFEKDGKTYMYHIHLNEEGRMKERVYQVHVSLRPIVEHVDKD